MFNIYFDLNYLVEFSRLCWVMPPAHFVNVPQPNLRTKTKEEAIAHLRDWWEKES